MSVITVQTVVRSDPKKTASVLKQTSDLAVGQTLLDGKVFKDERRLSHLSGASLGADACDGANSDKEEITESRIYGSGLGHVRVLRGVGSVSSSNRGVEFGSSQVRLSGGGICMTV